jgi:hypothetical protein
VTPDGRQRLVSRGDYRLNLDQVGPIVFQLHGNGYSFPAGDTIKLELAPSDAPYYRASNGSFTVSVTNAVLTLPILTPTRACGPRTIRLLLPRGRGVRVLNVSLYLRGHRIRTIRGRALRRRTLVLRRVPAGRIVVRIATRVTPRHGKPRRRTVKRNYRICI